MANMSLIEESLISYALSPQVQLESSKKSSLELLKGLPRNLLSIRHPDFIKSLTKSFEDQSHDGPYEDAWRSGRALLALCLILYPKHYPLTGYYALELAKACWNAHVSENIGEIHWAGRLVSVLDSAESILQVAGGEEEDEVASGISTVNELRSLMNSEHI
ncbi:hypothetical protein FRC17_001929 [Serendipita sp. 399]|nr:hypothetical protein FRC17_001929 [Serendipita sp. 399]